MFSIPSHIIPPKMLSTKSLDLWLDVVNDKNCLPSSQKALASYKCLDHSGVSARRGFNVTTWWKCLHAGTNELLLCVVCWYNSHKVTKCQKTQEVHQNVLFERHSWLLVPSEATLKEFLYQYVQFMPNVVKLRQGSGKDRQGMVLKVKGLKAWTLA